MLTALRQQGDALLVGYLTVVRAPGLTKAEADTIADRYRKWRQDFERAVKAPPPRLSIVVPSPSRIRSRR